MELSPKAPENLLNGPPRIHSPASPVIVTMPLPKTLKLLEKLLFQILLIPGGLIVWIPTALPVVYPGSSR